jgi:hypothetical protein
MHRVVHGDKPVESEKTRGHEDERQLGDALNDTSVSTDLPLADPQGSFRNTGPSESDTARFRAVTFPYGESRTSDLVATLILPGSVASAVWVLTYRERERYAGPVPSKAKGIYYYLPSYGSPAWTTPVAVLIGITAVGAAVLVLRRSR